MTVSTLTRPLTRWAERRCLSPVSMTGISLTLSACAAGWLSAGTETDSIVGGLVLSVGYLAWRGARQLATLKVGVTAESADRTAAALIRISGTASACVVYAGLAAGGLEARLDGTWELATAAMIVMAARELADVCRGRAEGASAGGSPLGQALAAVLSFPAGGRVVLIAVAAPLWGPRVTLLALLEWAAVATAYTLTRPGPERAPAQVTGPAEPVFAGPLSSGPVPSGPLSSGPVPSGPLSSGPVPSGPVPSGPVPSGPVSSTRVSSGTVAPAAASIAVGVADIAAGAGDVAIGAADHGSARSDTLGAVAAETGFRPRNAIAVGVEFPADADFPTDPGVSAEADFPTDPRVRVEAGFPSEAGVAGEVAFLPEAVIPADAVNPAHEAGMSAAGALVSGMQVVPPAATTLELLMQAEPDEPAPAPAGPRVLSVVQRSRDDGVVAIRLGQAVRGQFVPLPPALAGLAATSLLAWLGMRNLPGLLLLTPLVVMLLAAFGSANPHDRGLDWLTPAVLLAGQLEYTAALGFSFRVPALLTFTLCALITLRHVSLAPLDQRSAAWGPGAWLGWEGRMFVVGAGAMLGIATVAFAALAVQLTVLICGSLLSGYAKYSADFAGPR
jgi:hypothetical protein